MTIYDDQDKIIMDKYASEQSEEEDTPIKVKIINQEKIEKEVTIYDTQDDPEYQDMATTQEDFEKDVEENNGTQS